MDFLFVLLGTLFCFAFGGFLAFIGIWEMTNGLYSLGEVALSIMLLIFGLITIVMGFFMASMTLEEM